VVNIHIADMFSDNHAAIFGISKSGKSNFARALFAQKDVELAIYWNPQAEHLAAYRVSTPADLARAIAAGKDKINFIPSPDIANAEQEMKDITHILFNIGVNAYPEHRPPRPTMRFIIDEAPDLCTASYSVIDTLARRGNRYGIQAVAIAQTPADLSKSFWKQCVTSVFFNIGTFQERYFISYGMPYERIKTWTAKPYHFFIYTTLLQKHEHEFRPIKNYMEAR